MRSPFPTHSPPDLPAPRAALAKPPLSRELCRHGRGLITRKRSSPAIGHPGEVQTGECSEVGRALCSVSRRPRGAIHLAEVPPSPQLGPEAPSLGQKNGAERADFSGSQLRGLQALAVIKISNEARGQVPLTNRACAQLLMGKKAVEATGGGEGAPLAYAADAHFAG